MKKRIFAVLLALSLVLALFPAVSLPAAASTNGHTQAEAVAWANSQVGEYLDYDKKFGAQCWDLVKYYYVYLGNGDYAVGDATNFQSNKLPSGWTRVKSNPQPGDVIVWGGGTQGGPGWTVDPLGHIGIVVAVSGNNLTTLEQNIFGSPCKKVTRQASYAACFIRPDFSDKPVEAPVDPYSGDKPNSGKTYLIANKASGRLLDVYGDDNSSTNKSNVHIWEAVGTNKSQRFNVVKNSGGWWSIIPLSNTGLAVNPFSDNPGNGTNVNVYTKDSGDISQGWYFEAVNGGYYIIHSAYDTNVVLTAEGTSNKSNVKLAANAKTDHQLWKLTIDGEEPHVHDYAAEETKPTCTEEGFTTHTCKTCGDSYKDSTVPALGHSFENGVCTRCGTADPNPGSVSVTGVTLSKAALTLKVGDTASLTAAVSPADAKNKSVTWSSNNSSAVSVDANGKVTAKAAGAAEITVKTADGGFTAVCRVIVKGEDKPAPVEVHFPRVNVYNQGQFTDVPANQWYTENVKQAFEMGLMKGDSPTKFNPQGNVTVAQAITMAARLHSIYTTGGENFVQGGVWYQVYLDYAFQNGLISYAYYNSDVTKNATRAQFAEIFSNALPDEALSPISTVADGAIPDVPMSAAYASHVYKLYRAGILAGNDVLGTFSPDSYITRQEAAALVSRMAESSSRKTFSL